MMICITVLHMHNCPLLHWRASLTQIEHPCWQLAFQCVLVLFCLFMDLFLWMGLVYKSPEKEGKHSHKHLKDASGPSVDPSTVGPSLIRNGLHGTVAVKKPFLRKGNREKRLSYAKMTQEMDWKSVTTGLMEGWILPRARTSTLLKQCGIILTENGTKGSRHPKKSFEMSFKKPGELFLKTA